MAEVIVLIIIAMALAVATVAWLSGKPIVTNKPQIVITLFFDNTKIKCNLMALTLTTTQFVEGQLQAVDKRGNTAPIEKGSVEFKSSDESIFTVEENPDDESMFKIIAAAPGVAQLTFSADADLDQGEGETKTIEGFAAIEVLPAEAVGFGISFGKPQEQE